MNAPANQVALREVRPEDLPVLYENQADAEVARNAVVPLRSRETFMAHWEKLLADSTVVHRAITLGGALAGFVGAWTGEGERQVGYQLGRAFWGRGAATEGLRQFLPLEPHRPLSAHVAKQNAASVRVLEKCGFVLQREEPVTEQGVAFVDLHYRLDA